MTGLVAHGNDSGSTHLNGNSVWMLISMVAFSTFLLSIAWTLFWPRKAPKRTAADIATERYASGEIRDDEFERSVLDVDAHRR